MVKISNKLLNKLLDGRTRPRNQRRGRRPQRRGRAMRQARPQGNVHVHHANTLMNPSAGSLDKLGGVYAGEQGQITRLSLDYTISGGAANTCAYYIFHPNTGLISGAQVAAGSTSITPSFGVGAGTSPGYTFLNATARKVRGVAAGMKFTLPSLSFTTMVGEVAVGVISSDTIMNVSAFTVDQLFLHSGARGPINKVTQDVAWYPGSFDERYATYSGTIAGTGTDLSDTNVLYFAIRGLPVNTNVQVKVDWVCEWVALAGSGVAPSYSTSAGSDHQHTVEFLHKNHPGFWHSIKSEAEAIGKKVLHDGARTVGRKAERWVPSMLESGFAAFGI